MEPDRVRRERLEELTRAIRQLDPEELRRLRDFVAGLEAAGGRRRRMTATSAPPRACSICGWSCPDLSPAEARLRFNRCSRCGAWVCDAHFNENRGLCVRCAPRICRHCGRPVLPGSQFCTVCGAPQFEPQHHSGPNRTADPTQADL